MKPETVNVKVGAVVMATGWNPYDATKMDNLGFGTVQNVITNMMMERIAAPNGPTGGKIVRPSDGKEVKNIAFVQCAGSRDENHLAHCSYICCLASLKQATYVRELYPDSKVKIFYIDIRTPGLYENRFYTKIKEDQNVSFLKGKVAKVEQAQNGDVKVTAEDIHGRQQGHRDLRHGCAGHGHGAHGEIPRGRRHSGDRRRICGPGNAAEGHLCDRDAQDPR